MAKRERDIIFVHGFPLDSSMWEEQVKFFKKKYRTFAPDLPGFGKNFLQTPDSIKGFANYLKSFIDENKIKDAILCGFSMGGYITFAFYEMFPQSVSGLIFSDTRASSDDKEVKRNRDIAIHNLEKEGVSFFVENMPKKLLWEDSLLNLNLLKKVKGIIAIQKIDAIRNALIAMRDRKDRSYILKSIVVPTLFVCGEYDTLSPPEEMKSLSKMVVGSKFQTISRSGHLAPMENPKEFNQKIEEFLANI